MNNKLKLVAPCGLYCGECLGFQRGTCDGCRSGSGECLKYRKICGIFECCIIKKKLELCNQCNQFPCKKFNKFFETPEWYSEVVNNLKRIKKVGLKKWLKEQEIRVEKLKECAEEKGLKHCSQCNEWPCRYLDRPPLTPD